MKLVATLFLLFIYSFALSQINLKDSSFNCIAKWKKGEEKKLLIARNKKSYESGNLKSDFSFSYEAFVTILDSSKEGYSIQWIFHLPDEVKEATPGLAESMPVYEGLKMVFKTTNTGAFKELINWQEVKDAYIKMMEMSLPKNMDDKTREDINKSEELFNSKEMVESALIKEIILYHSPYGSVFTIKGYKQRTNLPNPFSTDSMPAILTEKIADLENKLDYVKITLDQQIDSGSAGKVFEGLLRKMNIPEDSVVEKGKRLLSDLAMTDHSEYIITLSTRWIKNMNYQRTAKTFQMENKDSFIIEIK